MQTSKSDGCTRIIAHLSRIQGQIDALKGYLEEKRSCEDVTHLTRSILTSFSSVRASIFEEMLCEELGDSLNMKKTEHLSSLIALYKS